MEGPPYGVTREQCMTRQAGRMCLMRQRVKCPRARAGADSAALDLAGLDVDHVPLGPHLLHGPEAPILERVAVQLHAVAVGVVEVDAAGHVVLDRGLDGDAELAELPSRVMQPRLRCFGRLAGGQLEEREVVVLRAKAQEHRPVLPVVVGHLQAKRASVELLRLLRVTHLQHDMAELASLNHPCPPAPSAPWRLQEMPYAGDRPQYTHSR